MSIHYEGSIIRKRGPRKEIAHIKGKEVIRGGLGDKLEYTNIEEVADPNSLLSPEEREAEDAAQEESLLEKESETIDLSLEDFRTAPVGPNEHTDTGPTLYDKQVEAAKNAPDYDRFVVQESVVTPKTTAASVGEILQEEAEAQADHEKIARLRERGDVEERKVFERNGWLHFLLRGKGHRHDDKSKKRGGRG